MCVNGKGTKGRKAGKEGGRKGRKALPLFSLSPVSFRLPVSVLPAFCFVSGLVLLRPACGRPSGRRFRFRPLSAQERTGTNTRPQGTKRGHGGLLKRLGNETEGRGGEGGHPHYVHSELHRGAIGYAPLPIPHYVHSEQRGPPYSPLRKLTATGGRGSVLYALLSCHRPACGRTFLV